jgi:hypothetical protein
MGRRVAIVFLLSMVSAVPIATATASVNAKKAPVCAGKTKAKATKAIGSTWSTLFDNTASASFAEKFAVVQDYDDPEFKALVDATAPRVADILATLTVDVTSVKCAGKKQATVGFDLILNGEPALPGQVGTATIDQGAWKAEKTTLCDLFGRFDPALLETGPCAL